MQVDMIFIANEQHVHPAVTVGISSNCQKKKPLAEGGELRATNVYEDRANVGWRFPCCP
jgi:hypothetical protein